MKLTREKTLEEIKRGYTKDKRNFFHCNYCDAVFEEGEIFPINGHFYRAEKVVQKHIEKEHGSVFNQLLQLDKKTSSLTDVQKKLLHYIHEGKSDKEIAALTNTSASTVRHQRFVFKEKAKQAKMYLALYELALEGMVDSVMDAHGQQAGEDKEVIISEEEVKLLEPCMISMEPLRLKELPNKEALTLILLRKVCECLEPHRLYSEAEINAFLKDIYEDDITLRNHLIAYGFLHCTKDLQFYSMDEGVIQKEEPNE